MSDQAVYDRRADYFSRHPVRPGDIVFVGDSMIELGSWEEWFKGAHVRNRGICGDHTQAVADRLDPILHRPAKVFLMIGANDIDFMVPEPSILTNVETILTKVLGSSPETEVYLQSLLPRKAEYAPQIQGVNDGYRELASRMNVAFVDLFPLFADAQGVMRPDLSADQFHLSPAGYEVWRDAVRPLVMPN